MTVDVSARGERIQRLKAYAASVGVVFLSCLVYKLGPHNAQQLERAYALGSFVFTGSGFLITAGLVYALLLLPHCLLWGDPQASKSLRSAVVVRCYLSTPLRSWRSAPPAPSDRVAVLATLLKAFFAPLMVMQLMIFCVGAIHNGAAMLQVAHTGLGFRPMFDRWGFWFTLQIILFVDVLIFTAGYLIELPRLRNEIRSVDSSLRGWLVTLMCYPPFNIVSGAILGSSVTEFPQFSDPTVHMLMNGLGLVLMAIYALASVALGWKASNLTHRGVIAHGPYRVVRHPAYTCKTLTWCIGSLPLVAASFSESFLGGLLAVTSVVAWTLVYALRALTEEDHLNSVDGEYSAYAERVRYRFIPGLI